ncbi:2-amino-4-hydroxy-6-hydroxymethyldihydropteridine diphosphokinase [Devosia insulae DS-56]|uniref:2-amino-4-hydroxy-6-hydroxymethyldihydropteridine pyrophosphokinase n=1 Tax=Devosia insulae DS-56 TaxID=1116389 RepID=A0A1E5XLJ0_9HYPH|nr:2-amino-4-hydroxy-6-hydroxymethyldihydropteridine diphosphokinase [Devosia insulae]OEO29374.1 2-amino-4-hydroxy-6-hydroxymethyldihydropteridine diphosphokinase [Devosia insulae DS-56]
MPRAWLGLGANIGDPAAQVREAVQRLDAWPGIAVVAQSAMLITKPWGKTDQPDFSNMVVEVKTSLAPVELLDACLGIERVMGRVRDIRWGPRRIDIDVVAYERLELDTERLHVPHRHAHERDFVLDPLREIAPEVAAWIVGRGR